MDREIREGRVTRLEPGTQRRLEALRRWSHLLDRAFRIPGTNIRFGWDPLVGLFPGLGDALSILFSGLILVEAFRRRIPRIVLARMVLNSAIDAAFGTFPFLGDLFDVVWKANTRNFELLERHAGMETKAQAGDWIFVVSILALLLLVVLLPFLLFLWIINTLLAPGRIS